MRAGTSALAVAASLALAACRDAAVETSRWPMVRADGPLQLQVRHPLPNDPVPSSGRDYVMGSVGNAGATLVVDGVPVPVQRNGSFLVYVHAAAAGSSYVLSAALGNDSARVEVPVSRGGATPAPAPALVHGAAVQSGPVVVVPAGNLLDAGLREIAARSAPEGDYTWFLLAGTRGEVTESHGDARLVRFPGGVSAWVDVQFLRAASPVRPHATRGAAVWLDERGGVGEIAVAAPEPLAYQVEEGEREVTFTVYGASPLAANIPAPPTGPVARIAVTGAAGPGVRVSAVLRGPVAGYEVVWRPGAMVLRLRAAPLVDAVRPMAGLTIVVDAGHPPGGAVGPTGLAEPVVTLDVARRVQRLLVSRGARVVMTRGDTAAVTLERRIAIARASNGNAFISIHADAVASGNDPSRDIGTAIYANRAHSVALAGSVHLALVEQLGLPDRGVRHGDYAVIRSTWLPAILCEGATLTIPAQEAAMADSTFREAYALGIANGVEVYFRQLRLHAAPGR